MIVRASTKQRRRRMNLFRKTFTTLAGLCPLILCGCVATPQTPPIKTTVAANYPAAAKLRRIAVLPFSGPDGARITAEFEGLLARASDGGGTYFTVIDRSAIQNAVNELKFSLTGLVDPAKQVALGKFLGVEGIYTGTVSVPPAARQTRTEPRFQCSDTGSSGKLFSPCKSSYRTTATCTDKTIQFVVAVRLVEVATGQVIYSQPKTGMQTDSFCSDLGGEIPDATMLGSAAASAIAQLRDDVAPHDVIFRPTLKTSTEGLDAKTVERFASAMEFNNAGRLERACAIWSDMAGSGSSFQSLDFNLGICDEVGNRIEEAYARFKRLDDALQRPDKDISTALLRTRDKLLKAKTEQIQLAPAAAPASPAKPGKRPKGSKVPDAR